MGLCDSALSPNAKPRKPDLPGLLHILQHRGYVPKVVKAEALHTSETSIRRAALLAVRLSGTVLDEAFLPCQGDGIYVVLIVSGLVATWCARLAAAIPGETRWTHRNWIQAPMKIPPDAVIAREKLTEYLLVPRDQDDKSGYLAQVGFDLSDPDLLLQAIRRLADESEAVEDGENEYGVFYRADGELKGRDGERLAVATIWLRWHLDGRFRFVTLKPLRGGGDEAQAL